MNKKKALSLLLATAMVFTMNTISFAAETTNTAESVETQVVYKDDAEMKKALGQSDNVYGRETYKTDSENSKVLAEAEKAGIYFGTIPSAVTATGKKITSSAIVGSKGYYRILVSANGYRTSVKKVKFTSNAKDCGSEVSFKVSALNGAKFVEKYDATNRTFVSLQSKEAKEGLKAIKNSLSTIKGYEFKAVITPQYLDGAVSNNFIKSLGKTVSAGAVYGLNDAKIDLRHKVVVTTKNGTVKKVQVLAPQWLKSTDANVGSCVTGTTVNGEYADGSYAKLKLRTLKKNKDYTLSGNTVVVDNSKVFYTMADDLKNFEAKW